MASAIGPSAIGPSAIGPSAIGPSAIGPSAIGPSAIGAIDEDDDEKLDTSWIKQFKDEEVNYNDFYKEPITSIMVYVLYIKDKELNHIDSNICLLENGNLVRERIISLIKHYEIREIKYKLTGLLRYNIDLNPEDINDFINETIGTDRFMTPEKYLNNIHYNDSIHMFQDLNALYFIYEATSAAHLNHTKKITLNNNTKTKRNKKNLKINKEIR
jgi:hypothetical protein